MNISINPINNTKTSFQAKPLAKYCYLNDKVKNVIVYQLEKKDIEYLKYILDNIDKFYKIYEIKDESTKQISKKAFEAGIKILSEQDNKESKAKILLALSENNPSAVLVGNTLKADKNGHLHYSSRKNHAKDETELDALATWNNKIPGEGKTILCEYFHTVLKDGFKQIFVRSEIPENSFAVEFYKKMGFKLLSKKLRHILRKNDNNYIEHIFDYGEDKIVPMKATTRDIVRTLKKRSRELIRKEINDNYSVDLPLKELMNILA